MANFKSKILDRLNNNQGLNDVFYDLETSQKNLLKNYSNSAVKNEDKNGLLLAYSELEDLKKSIIRYDIFINENFTEDAKLESDNIEGKILKTGISNVRYIWHSENSENTCDKCKALDGKEFDYYDEIPERPHPNCKCWVVIVNLPNETKPEKIAINDNSYVKPEKLDLYDMKELLSVSSDISEFVISLSKDLKISKNVIKKALYEFEASMGRKLEQKYKDELYLKVSKIIKECAHDLKYVKIAGEITERVAPVLAFAYILEEVIRGYYEGGIDDAVIKSIIAVLEIIVYPIIISILLPELPKLYLTMTIVSTMPFLDTFLNLIADKILKTVVYVFKNY